MKSNRFGQFAMPTAVVGVVLMMVVPLPAFMLDIMIVLNITASMLVLLVAMFVQKPLDFSIFPPLILISTIFRLALNVSATRLILSRGFGGNVIEAFGTFVISGSLIVGLVVFLILVVIQFVVITNGAGRVAEVAARFTLDAMPGKQMAVDADLNAGLIDENQARLRRREIAAEADFYGAMDGASKFVKGDAIAAVVMVLINLLGGFAIGVLQNGMSLADAMSTYSTLTVGDGLVSQVPALLLSIATGLIVTRAATENDFGTDFLHEFGRQSKAVQIAGGAICALGLVPGMPKLPFLLVGGSLLALGFRLARTPEPEAEAVAEEAPLVEPDSPEAIAESVRVDPIKLEVSYDLIDLVDPGRGGDLLDRVRALRKKIAGELGVVIPLVRTCDNLDLPQSTYAIRVHGVEVGRGVAPPGQVLVIGDTFAGLSGIATRDPVFGLDAMWVPASERDTAEIQGGTVVDRASVVTTHLAEVVRRHAADLLGRQDVKMLVDIVARSNPTVVEEMTPGLLSLGEVQAVLQALLQEGVAITDLSRIFEAISEKARHTKDTDALVEAARATLGAAVAAPYAIDGHLAVVTIEPIVEHSLFESLRQGEHGSFLALEPEYAQALVLEVARINEGAAQRGETPALVCSPLLRPALRRLTRGEVPGMPVLSYVELGDALVIEPVGVVSLSTPATVS